MSKCLFVLNVIFSFLSQSDKFSSLESKDFSCPKICGKTFLLRNKEKDYFSIKYYDTYIYLLLIFAINEKAIAITKTFFHGFFYTWNVSATLCNLFFTISYFVGEIDYLKIVCCYSSVIEMVTFYHISFKRVHSCLEVADLSKSKSLAW